MKNTIVNSRFSGASTLLRSTIVGALFCAPLTSIAQHEAHDHDIEEVVVRAHLLSDGGASQSIDVLSGDALADSVRGSLGETVANIVGVRNASFGSAVGRPVIHGLGGARVKTTEDRIDSLDVSVTSTDHAVAVEPFIANQITILKGASTLLYGSGAIGGVVDTETGRIPVALNEEGLTGRAEVRAADNADATTAAFRLDGNAGDNFAWHVDAFSREADDYEFAGELESQALRDSEGEEAEEEENTGVLEGSGFETSGGAIGASFITEKGFIGASVSVLDSDYGLVGGHHEEEEEEEEFGEEEEEGVGVINLEQTRFDLEGQLNNPFAGIEKINVRFGVNDYEHLEIEGNGEVGTLFDNDAWEARLEVSHSEIAGFDGAFGLQLNDREFSAIGEEAFVPPVESDSIGAFWVGQRDFSGWTLESGVRVESVDHNPVDAGLIDTSFTSFSSSLGALIEASEVFDLSVLLDFTERAPSIEELYSNGPHLATQTFEIGDQNLTEESAIGLSVSGHYHTEQFEINATFYANQFDDFIYQESTGEIEDDLPVLLYRQNDADFVGLDLEFALHLTQVLGGDLDLSAQFDFVDADVELDSGAEESLPRIPADSQALALNWNNDVWRANLRFTNVSAQDDVASFEFATESYTDISFQINRRIEIADSSLDLFLNGSNLSDEEQREHTSFVKDVAPAPGRRLEVGARFSF